MAWHINQDLLILVARALLATVYVFSGVIKIVYWDGAVAEFEVLGVPSELLLPTVVVQLFAGLGLLLGFAFRASAVLLAIFTAAATLAVHAFWLAPESVRLMQATVFLEHMAIIGGMILIAAVGAGRYSVSAFLQERAR